MFEEALTVPLPPNDRTDKPGRLADSSILTESRHLTVTP